MTPNEIISGYSHTFDTGIAQGLGLHSAIVYNHIIYWLRINANKSSEKANFHEGKFWMYETRKEMSDFFGYISEDEIYKAIKKLVEAGLILKGNFNKSAFDKTLWYTVTDQELIKPKDKIKKMITKPSIDGIGNVMRRDPERHLTPSNISIENQEEHQDNDDDGMKPSVSTLKISFLDGKEKQISKEDIYSLAVTSGCNWTVSEIDYVYERLASYENERISDLKKLCIKIINNKSKADRAEKYANKKKQETKKPEHEKIPVEPSKNLKRWGDIMEIPKTKKENK